MPLPSDCHLLKVFRQNGNLGEEFPQTLDSPL